MLSGCHVERVRDVPASIQYAQKADTRVEGPFFFGSRETRKREFDAVSELQTRSVVEVLQENPGQWRAVRVLRELRGLVMPQRSSRTLLYYIWGKTGCGKTQMMRRFLPYVSVYWKDGSKWWNGYDQQDIVVVDEYHGLFNSSELLRFGDASPFTVEYKGGVVQFNSYAVVFLSNLPPGDTIFLHSNDDVVEAIGRRFCLIRL